MIFQGDKEFYKGWLIEVTGRKIPKNEELFVFYAGCPATGYKAVRGRNEYVLEARTKNELKRLIKEKNEEIWNLKRKEF